VRDTDWKAAYRRTDLVPVSADEVTSGDETVTIPVGLSRVAGAQHVMSGDGTLCGIPVSEVEVMPFLFTLRPDRCEECLRRLEPQGDDALVSVSAHRDSPEAESLAQERDLVGDFSVFFSDEAAHREDDLVGKSVAFIEAFPGVQRAVREDRELIYGWGDVEPRKLQRALVKWWNHHIETAR